MNAPVRIQIDDATKRKADMWDEVCRGELSRDEAELIDLALSELAERWMANATVQARLAQKARRKGDADWCEAHERVARSYRLTANRSRELQDKLTRGGNLYLGEG